MSSLYDLTANMIEVQEMIDQYLESGSDEELQLAYNLETAKEILIKEIENKTSNITYAFKNMDSEIDILEAEIKRLQDRKSATQKRKENLKKLVIECMETMGTKKISTPVGTVSIRNNPVKLELEELSSDSEYVTEVVEYKVDRKAILKDLKLGKEIEGAKLIPGGTSLMIK